MKVNSDLAVAEIGVERRGPRRTSCAAFTDSRLWHAVSLRRRHPRSNVRAIHSFHRFIHTIRRWQKPTKRTMRPRLGATVVDNHATRGHADQQLDLGGAKWVGTLTVGGGATTRRATRRSRAGHTGPVAGYPRRARFNPPTLKSPRSVIPMSGNRSGFSSRYERGYDRAHNPAVTKFTGCGS